MLREIGICFVSAKQASSTGVTDYHLIRLHHIPLTLKIKILNHTCLRQLLVTNDSFAIQPGYHVTYISHYSTYIQLL